MPTMLPDCFDGYYTNIASKGCTIKAIHYKQIPFKMPIVQLPLDFIYGGGVHGAYFPYNKQGYYKDVTVNRFTRRKVYECRWMQQYRLNIR